MAEKTVDRRVQRPRRLLHKALMSNLVEKKYESITVQEILDRADVGRSTFYTHFHDKDELLVSGFENLRSLLRSAQAAAEVPAGKPYEKITGSSLPMHRIPLAYDPPSKAASQGYPAVMAPTSGLDFFRSELASLVESFRKRRLHFQSEGYDDAQLRADFVTPFWRALGWDVENRSHQPLSLRDVEVETRVHIAGRKKRADYVFRQGGVARFVCETAGATDHFAKKAAYNCQRYAFNLKLFVSVLTNFETLQVFIAGGRPEPSDPFPAFRQWNFLEFEVAARELWELFSKDAVINHSIEKLVERLKKKPQPGKKRERWLFIPERVRTVDQEFLNYIERQREDLAHLLVSQNASFEWTEAALNDCIQRIIDRILFVRICEDRDIDTGRTLEAILDEWETIRVGRESLYPRLVAHFNSLNVLFNGTLFRIGHPSEKLKIPDDFLVRMIRDLSNESSPYLFSILPLEILGSVYEQFIGRVGRLTGGGKVKVEPKAEVRKAGGIYYTPGYVVDYIVQKTVGDLITKKDLKAISKLRFLDPACGSGSFLLKIFERVCEEYISWFQSHPRMQRKEFCYKDETGTLHLTPHLKRQIMMNNVYGVDIDFRAVEVTMFSLYLKILEGETRTTLGHYYQPFSKETLLPDLSRNIRCGNSLIASDFYKGERLSMFENRVLRGRVNAFDWKTEFKEILGSGGFDAVVGNPPYVLLQDELKDEAQLDYFREKYRVASYKIDTYHLFTELGARLTKANGKFSLITPANFLTNNYLRALRRFLLDETEIDCILVIDGGVFEGVSVDNAIFVLTSGKPTKGEWPLIHAVPLNRSFRELSQTKIEISREDKAALFTGSRRSSALWAKVLHTSVLLEHIADVNFGKQLRDRAKFPRDVIDVSQRKLPKGYKPCYTGKDILRYMLQWNNLACLDRPVARRGGCWDPSRQNAKRKLLTRQIGKFPEFALDRMGYQCLNTIFMINVHSAYDPYFVLGMLNSKLIRAFWIDRYFDQRRTFPKIKGSYLEQLPLFDTNKTSPEKPDEISQLAQAIEALTVGLRGSTTDHDRDDITRQIEAADTRINELLFSLYGLTDEEVEQIETVVHSPGLRPNAVKAPAMLLGSAPQ